MGDYDFGRQIVVLIVLVGAAGIVVGVLLVAVAWWITNHVGCGGSPLMLPLPSIPDLAQYIIGFVIGLLVGMGAVYVLWLRDIFLREFHEEGNSEP